MRYFKKLELWKLSMELCTGTHTVTRKFPREEQYALTSQMMRCAVSIPSNIAEGCGRRSDKELNRFLNISLGSSFELETQMILAHTFNYMDDSHLENLQEKNASVQRMIHGLQQKLIVNN